jgi:hypothetical protein
VASDLAQFKQSSVENAQARMATAPSGTVQNLPPQSFTFNVSWEPAQINDRYISILVRVSYFDGGANGAEDLKAFNYDVPAGKIMALGDLFPNAPNYLSQIAEISKSELESSLNDASNGNAPSDMITNGTAPSATNYANFTFSDQTVTIYFEKYQVAPGSFGEQQVTITRVAIR